MDKILILLVFASFAHPGIGFRLGEGVNVHKFIMFGESHSRDMSEEKNDRLVTMSHKMMSSATSRKLTQPAILPVCCHMETEEVVYFQCGNSLDYGGRTTSWNAPAHLVSTDVPTKFRLEKSFLSCRASNVTKYIYISDSVSEANHFSTDGYLRYEDEYFRPDEYCINGFNEEKLEVIICRVNCADPQTPCINKCCGLNEIYSLGYGENPRGCVTLEQEDKKWFPKLYHDMDTPLSSYEQVAINPHIIQNFPTNFKFNCITNQTTVFPHGEEVAAFLSTQTNKPYLNLPFRVTKDGSLVYPQNFPNGTWAPITSHLDNYCVDGVQDYGEVSDFSNNEAETILFLCSGGPELGYALPDKFKPTTTSTTTQKSKNKHRTHTQNKNKQIITKTTTPTPLHNKKTTASEVEIGAPTTSAPSIRVPSISAEAYEKLIPLPTCCHMGADVDLNDGTTHHCKGRISEETNVAARDGIGAVWKVPPPFMTTSNLTTFSLKKRPVICKSGRFQFQGFIHNFGRKGARAIKKNGIFPDGHIKYENEFYRQDEYCVNGISPRIVEVLICKPYCSSSETPCIQKCCGINEIYSLGLPSKENPSVPTYRGCQPLNPDDSPWNPKLFHDMKSQISNSELYRIKPHIVQKYPPAFQHNCHNNVTLAFPYSKEVAMRLGPQENAAGVFKHLQFRVRKDGKLMYAYPGSRDTGFTSIMESSDFCIDGIRNYGESVPFTNRENQTILFICAINQPTTTAPSMVDLPFDKHSPISESDSAETQTMELQTKSSISQN